MVVRHRDSRRSGCEEARVQQLVAAGQQIVQRRGLRLASTSRCAQSASTESSVGAARACSPWPSLGPTSPSRTAAESERRARAVQVQAQRRVAGRRRAPRATPRTPARDAAATLPRPHGGHAVRGRRSSATHASRCARPWLRLARLRTGLRSAASMRAIELDEPLGRVVRRGHERQRGVARVPERVVEEALERAGPASAPACIAASSPPECANPPAGNVASASWRSKPVAHLRTASSAVRAATSVAGVDCSSTPSARTS